MTIVHQLREWLDFSYKVEEILILDIRIKQKQLHQVDDININELIPFRYSMDNQKNIKKSPYRNDREGAFFYQF